MTGDREQGYKVLTSSVAKASSTICGPFALPNLSLPLSSARKPKEGTPTKIMYKRGSENQEE
jgi:hypothetical protein